MDAASPIPVESSSSTVFATIEQPFVGRWNELVSTTNWEKGRIIFEWREALVAAAAPTSEFSDETWSRRVGGVTSQHVGRLRRVYHRFASMQSLYHGLFWSHFQAALDWDDAEMWLEGAAGNGWSVEAMRGMRAETIAEVSGRVSGEQELPAADIDEDYVPPLADNGHEPAMRTDFADTPLPAEGPDFGDDDSSATDGDDPTFTDNTRDAIAYVQPFENLAELPPDFADAFDAMKLCVLRHKNEGWQQVSRDDALAALDALKQLVLTPSMAEEE